MCPVVTVVVVVAVVAVAVVVVVVVEVVPLSPPSLLLLLLLLLPVATKVLPPGESPHLPGFYFFEVETLGRVHTLLVGRKEEDAQVWVTEIRNVMAASVGTEEDLR